MDNDEHPEAAESGLNCAASDVCVPGCDTICCEPGKVLSGQNCVPAFVYVNGSNGSDEAGSGDGSLEHPFRTFAKAMSRAIENQTVHFAPGVYGVGGTEDTFTEAIPAGVRVEGSDDATAVTFAADETRSLVFAGTGALANLRISGFGKPLSAASGVQTIDDVSFENLRGPLVASGKATVEFSQVTITGAPPNTIVDPTQPLPAFVWVLDEAWLSWTSGDIIGTFSQANCTRAEAAPALFIAGSSKLNLTNVTVKGTLAQAVVAEDHTTLNVANSHFGVSCGDVSIAVQDRTPEVEDGGSTLGYTRVSLFQSVFESTVLVSTHQELTARGCRFNGSAGLNISGSDHIDDLGTPESRGDNDFHSGPPIRVILFGPHNRLKAFGNFWIPNAQGAKADGTYDPGTVISNEAGSNFYALASNRVEL